MKINKAELKIIRVGFLGLGSVGKAVARLLHENRDRIKEQLGGTELRVVRVVVRDLRKKREGVPAGLSLSTDAAAVVGAEDIDIMCELMGGVDRAYAFIRESLRRGRSVVSANKAVIARHGTELQNLAAAHHCSLHYEGAVASGLPILRVVREGLRGDRILRVVGILNGTCNFILSNMQEGQSYGDALAQAQKLGYAEADPALDVSGADSADKLAILSRLAFGLDVAPQKISTQGIARLVPEVLKDADELGYRVKLLACAEQNEEGLRAFVAPVFVAKTHPLSNVMKAQNALAVEGKALGLSFYQGPGAGGPETATAVVADLLSAAQEFLNQSGGVRPLKPARSVAKVSTPSLPSPYYLRMQVADQPGTLAQITKILAAEKISLATVLQAERAIDKNGTVPVVLMSHEVPEAAMLRAARKLRQMRSLRGDLHVLRVWG